MPASFVFLLLLAADAPQATSLLGKALFALPDADGKAAAAGKGLAASPKDTEAIWQTARAHDAINDFKTSLALYSRGIQLKPADARFWRGRGHRKVSIRDFTGGVRDLEKARELAPSSFEVSYYLGLAYYLAGNFAGAGDEIARCDNMAGKKDDHAKTLPPSDRSCADLNKDADALYSLAAWHYLVLRRTQHDDEVKQLLGVVKDGSVARGSEAATRLLQFYKGALNEKTALSLDSVSPVTRAWVQYGIGMEKAARGDNAAACRLLRAAAAGSNWSAFGVIAAEVELTRNLRAACALIAE
jgi:tetratricopeptide (TPR) repeat protein